nr:hypothetical protein [Tanacetum cinerariifolium]
MEHLREEVSEVDNQLGKRIKVLRLDQGAEYFTREFDTFYEKNDIKHERTSPYTPQQNGLAKRKSRTIVEMVNYMLNQAGLPTYLWGESLLVVIFVSYAKKSKAYRLVDEKSGVIIDTIDVELFEDKFAKDVENPRASLVPTSTSSYHVEISTEINELRRSTTTIYGISETKSYLSSNFKMKDLGEVDNILGIKVKRTNDQISLSQSHYIEKILTKFQHLHIKESNVPFEQSVHLEKNYGRAVAQLEYASFVGYLMHAAHYTRLDIAFAIRKLSDSKSMSGWNYTLVGGVVSWASKKQTCISHSIMEAEFIALAAAGKEAEWMLDLILDIQLL